MNQPPPEETPPEEKSPKKMHKKGAAKIQQPVVPLVTRRRTHASGWASPRDIFEAIGVTPAQLFDRFMDLHGRLNTVEGPLWADEALQVATVAAETIYFYKNPKAARERIEKAQAQDEARRRYLADEDRLRELGIPIEKGALHYLRTKHRIPYKGISRFMKAWEELKFPKLDGAHLGDPIHKITPAGFEEKPPSVGTLVLDNFALAWKKREHKRSN